MVDQIATLLEKKLHFTNIYYIMAAKLWLLGHGKEQTKRVNEASELTRQQPIRYKKPSFPQYTKAN